MGVVGQDPHVPIPYSPTGAAGRWQRRPTDHRGALGPLDRVEVVSPASHGRECLLLLLLLD